MRVIQTLSRITQGSLNYCFSSVQAYSTLKSPYHIAQNSDAWCTRTLLMRNQAYPFRRIKDHACN